jgi:pimeloyl-ACP methyl ester carboxylesterase
MTPDDLQVTHHFAQLGSLRMHFVERGTGPTLVLLHGFPESWWSWRHQIAQLADAGFRVVAPDLRGYGETDKQGPYDLDTVTRDVCMLIESLGAGPTAHVIGHDWGGAVAWHLAANYPERCASMTAINCPQPAAMGKTLTTHPRQLARSWYMFLFQVPHLAEWLLTRHDATAVVRLIRAAAIDKTNFSAEELRPLREGILRPGAAAAMVGWYRSAFVETLKRRGKPESYPKVQVDSMLIWGLADRALSFDDLVPPTREYAADLRIEPIPDCGHFPHAERPDVVNRMLLSFLKDSGAKTRAAPGDARPAQSP